MHLGRVWMLLQQECVNWMVTNGVRYTINKTTIYEMLPWHLLLFTLHRVCFARGFPIKSTILWFYLNWEQKHWWRQLKEHVCVLLLIRWKLPQSNSNSEGNDDLISSLEFSNDNFRFESRIWITWALPLPSPLLCYCSGYNSLCVSITIEKYLLDCTHYVRYHMVQYYFLHKFVTFQPDTCSSEFELCILSNVYIVPTLAHREEKKTIWNCSQNANRTHMTHL